MRWSWKLTAQHYRFYPHENITHLTIGPGIDDFSTLKKLLEPGFKLSLTVMPYFSVPELRAVKMVWNVLAEDVRVGHSK